VTFTFAETSGGPFSAEVCPYALGTITTNALRWRSLGGSPVDWLVGACWHRLHTRGVVGDAFRHRAAFASVGFIAQAVWS
jgi:hypothetical protein